MDLPRGGIHVPIRVVLSHIVTCKTEGRRMYRDESASYVRPAAPARPGGFVRVPTLHLACPPIVP
jgi:hypothetical protein